MERCDFWINFITTMISIKKTENIINHAVNTLKIVEIFMPRKFIIWNGRCVS